eukprot:6173694-Prymnesium_polylepis.2
MEKIEESGMDRAVAVRGAWTGRAVNDALSLRSHLKSSDASDGQARRGCRWPMAYDAPGGGVGRLRTPC